MKSHNAVVRAWAETLIRKGDAPAIFNKRGEVLRTFRQIEDYALAVEEKFGAIKPGNIHVIQVGNHESWPSLLIAAWRKRLTVLPLDKSLGERERDMATTICNRSALIDWGNETPALFKLTSGTTAEPRLIRFRSEQLLADCNQICETMGITDCDINFAVIPLSHSYGFSNLVTPLIARGVPIALSSDPMPRAILDDLEQSGATVFPGMPVFYQAFCELENIPALERLRLCISAGAPLSADVARRFREKFHRSIHSFYGSSECGGICYDQEGLAAEEGFVGAAMNGVTVEVLEPGAESSQVRVKSDAVGDGYFPQPNEEKLGNGFFIPDDLLRKTEGDFRVVGRVSDLINVAGKKVNPVEIETELLRCMGVKQAIVFGRQSSLRNQEVVACVVAAGGLTESSILEFCRHRLSGWRAPKQIFLVDEIPINDRGKISRRELAQKFATEKA
jgi:acyl-CoA synthetase (AMP-forming)/AMP-acid ligase II